MNTRSSMLPGIRFQHDHNFGLLVDPCKRLTVSPIIEVIDRHVHREADSKAIEPHRVPGLHSESHQDRRPHTQYSVVG